MIIFKALNIARLIESIEKSKAGFNIPAFLSQANDDLINDLFDLNDKKELNNAIDNLENAKDFKTIVVVGLLSKFGEEMSKADAFDKSIRSMIKDKQAERDARDGVKKTEKTITHFKYLIDVISELGRAGNYNIEKLTVLDCLIILDNDEKNNKLKELSKLVSQLDELDQYDFDDMIAESDLDNHGDLNYLIARARAKVEVKNGKK